MDVPFITLSLCMEVLSENPNEKSTKKHQKSQKQYLRKYLFYFQTPLFTGFRPFPRLPCSKAEKEKVISP